MSPSQQRILSLWLPRLPTDRIFRQRFGSSWHSRLPRGAPPLVISHREGNAQRIAALDSRAEALRLKVGMGIADASAMHPVIEVVEADPEADRRVLERIADWCDRYTPLVALDGGDGLFLDITGCTHLFGGEKAMLEEILSRLFQQGFRVHAGLASTPGAAWAAARFLNQPVIASGREAEALAPLPLAALRLDPDVRNSLERLGLRTVGSILSAPRAPLARRFGKSLLLRVDQALGRIDEAISPRLPAPALSVERRLAEPVVLKDDIEALVLILAGSLKTDLERRGEGAKALALVLFRVDGMVSRITIGASRPLRDPLLVQKLFHEKLVTLGEAIDAGYGFDLVRLSVPATASFEPSQTSLCEEVGKEETLALLIDRIEARLGRGVVLKPVPVESHVPERAVAHQSFAEALATAANRKYRAGGAGGFERERPIRLLRRPEPVEVMAEVPEGPPVHFRWRRAHYRIARAEGPERIEPEWWLENIPDVQVKENEDPEEAGKQAALREMASLTRDYFRVEDTDGRRYWLYRQGLYESSGPRPSWFLHGLFA